MSDLVSFDHSSTDPSVITADPGADPGVPDPSAFDPGFFDPGFFDASGFDVSGFDGSAIDPSTFGSDGVPIDVNGDGTPDAMFVHPGTSGEGLFFPTDHSNPPWYEPAHDPGSGDSGIVDPFSDWTHSAADGFGSTGDVVHGTPAEDLQWAQIQTENGFCVPTSIAMVASEFAGHEIGAQSAVTEAEQLGYLTRDGAGNWSGLDIQQGQDLLEHLGVACHVESGTLDTLRQYLDEGRAIVLGVNSNDIWNPDSAAAHGPNGAIDHAVVITGIDDTTGTVTLDDPGTPNGAGEHVSISDLENAWDDGNNEMIVTDGTPATHDATGSNGFAMLPVVLPGTTM
jgi:hypothetical protein